MSSCSHTVTRRVTSSTKTRRLWLCSNCNKILVDNVPPAFDSVEEALMSLDKRRRLLRLGKRVP